MGNLTYVNILVAIDGSIQSEWAIRKGIEIAKRNMATLYIVNVIEQRAFLNEGITAQEKAEKDAK